MAENIAVFIDGDNINYNDVTYIMKEISNYGNINICSVYAYILTLLIAFFKDIIYNVAPE